MRSLVLCALLCAPLSALASSQTIEFEAPTLANDEQTPLPEGTVFRECYVRIADSKGRTILQAVYYGVNPGQKFALLMRPSADQDLLARKDEVWCTDAKGGKGTVHSQPVSARLPREKVCAPQP